MGGWSDGQMDREPIRQLEKNVGGDTQVDRIQSSLNNSFQFSVGSKFFITKCGEIIGL